MRALYLALAVLGFALPLSQFVPFLLAAGPDVRLFLSQLFATPISLFFGLDVLVSAVAVGVFVMAEGRRRRMGRLWAYVLATLAVGPSFGLPLFLYVRERYLRESARAAYYMKPADTDRPASPRPA